MTNNAYCAALGEVVRSAREAVRNRVSDIRRWAAMRPDTVAMEAHRQRIERERTPHARELAAMRRVLVHAFPAMRPRAVALVDVGAREVTTAQEVVVGSAPGWADPWARARRAFVATDAWHSASLLVDEQGYETPRADVQLARLLDGPRDNK